MLKPTPDWETLSNLFINKLDDVADELNLKAENGEDPAFAVTDAITDLEKFIITITQDPSQFTMRDVS